MIWYSSLLKNFPQFGVIHTVNEIHKIVCVFKFFPAGKFCSCRQKSLLVCLHASYADKLMIAADHVDRSFDMSGHQIYGI